MKFDIVIGNPPYNNDIYIPFVELGHRLAKQCSCFITPAKWQAKGGEKNEQFRKEIVPHMSKIVYYPCTCDIFDKVSEVGGISYYLIDKNTYNISNLKIKCSLVPIMNTNNFEQITINNNIKLLNYLCNDIVNKCSSKNKLIKKLSIHKNKYIKDTDSGYAKKQNESDVEVWGGKAGGERDANGNTFQHIGYYPVNELNTIDDINRYKVCISCMIGGTASFGAYNKDGTALGLMPTFIIGNNQINKGSYYCLMCFDTIDEAKSLQSYLNTRLIRFLVRCSTVGTSLSEEFFNLVPDPGAFDHIFTDEELYKKYNLTEEEINIIESVIKERK